MRPAIQRGKIVYLNVGGHARILPGDDTVKLASRPFLVVQNDILNLNSDTTLVVRVISAPARVRNIKEGGVAALLPKGILKTDSVADCAFVQTVLDSEITEDISRDTYSDKVMKKVDAALRTAMYLDPDGVLKEA